MRIRYTPDFKGNYNVPQEHRLNDQIRYTPDFKGNYNCIRVIIVFIRLDIPLI